MSPQRRRLFTGSLLARSDSLMLRRNKYATRSPRLTRGILHDSCHPRVSNTTYLFLAYPSPEFHVAHLGNKECAKTRGNQFAY